MNWGDGSGNTSIGNITAAGTIPAASHTYASNGNDTVTETVSDSGNHTSNIATFVIDVARFAPVFSNLTGWSSIYFGAAATTLSGTIAAGTSIPPGNETVAVYVGRRYAKRRNRCRRQFLDHL